MIDLPAATPVALTGDRSWIHTTRQDWATFHWGSSYRAPCAIWNASHLLFQLVAARYERGSILLTSNQGLADWGRTLGDDVVATAILDRLLHHSQVITIQGDSYRLRTKRRAGMVSSRDPAPTPTSPR